MRQWEGGGGERGGSERRGGERGGCGVGHCMPGALVLSCVPSPSQEDKREEETDSSLEVGELLILKM